MKAQVCVLFSDIDGLYTASPFLDKNAVIIPRVEHITPDIMAHAGASASTVGSGGMVTKIRAARVLMIAGIPLVICQGKQVDNLLRIASGKQVGTLFEGRKELHDTTPRKLWIALGDKARGSLVVDGGARQALVSQGSSLLAVGVRDVQGAFATGDIVDIKDEQGNLFARGRAGASASEIELAKGRSQSDIKANELLAHLARGPVVHRDELVVFE